MLDGLGKDSAVDKGVSWLPLFHDMGLIGFVIGPLFTDIPSSSSRPRASSARRASGSTRSTSTAAPSPTRRTSPTRWSPSASRRRTSRGSISRACASRAAAPSPSRPRRSATSPQQARAGGLRPAGLPPVVRDGRGDARHHVRPAARGSRTDRPRASRPERRGASPPTARARSWSTAGVPFPGHEVAIVDESGRSASASAQIGQIVTRGPSVTPATSSEPELTAQAFKTLPDDAAGPGSTPATSATAWASASSSAVA